MPALTVALQFERLSPINISWILKVAVPRLSNELRVPVSVGVNQRMPWIKSWNAYVGYPAVRSYPLIMRSRRQDALWADVGRMIIDADFFLTRALLIRSLHESGIAARAFVG